MSNKENNILTIQTVQIAPFRTLQIARGTYPYYKSLVGWAFLSIQMYQVREQICRHLLRSLYCNKTVSFNLFNIRFQYVFNKSTDMVPLEPFILLRGKLREGILLPQKFQVL